jgi:hypothetical protein
MNARVTSLATDRSFRVEATLAQCASARRGRRRWQRTRIEHDSRAAAGN